MGRRVRRAKLQRGPIMVHHLPKPREPVTQSLADWGAAYPDRAVTRSEMIKIFDSYAQAMTRRQEDFMAKFREELTKAPGAAA